MPYYSLEFILHTGESESHSTVKNYLVEWAQELEITECSRNDCAPGKEFRIRMRVQDPTVIFDTCAQFGRIKSVKIDEG
jgi:hypothetical protein